MGLGGVAIAILPSIICLKLTFSDGLGERIGLKIPLTTYVARHTWASVARNVNVPVSVISVGMGHRSIKTTEVYLDSVDISRVNEANRMLINRIEG